MPNGLKDDVISFAECTSNLYGTCLSVPHFNLSSSLLPYYNSSFRSHWYCVSFFMYTYIYMQEAKHWYISSTSEKCLIRLKIITSSSKSRIYLQIIHNIPLIYIHAHIYTPCAHFTIIERFNTIFITR